jgi:quinolinate synthase
VKILTWKGHCEVHERFTAEELLAYKEADPEIKIVAHPECPPDVVDVADYTGSTSGMINYVKDRNHPEGAAGDRMLDGFKHLLEGARGEVRPAVQLCPHMKRITLPKILDSLLRDEGGDPRRSRHRRPRPPGRRAHGQPEALIANNSPRANPGAGGWRTLCRSGVWGR